MQAFLKCVDIPKKRDTNRVILCHGALNWFGLLTLGKTYIELNVYETLE
jgi:hypothetical protein